MVSLNRRAVTFAAQFLPLAITTGVLHGYRPKVILLGAGLAVALAYTGRLLVSLLALPLRRRK